MMDNEELEEERQHKQTLAFLASLKEKYHNLFGHDAERLSVTEIQEAIRTKAVRPYKL